MPEHDPFALGRSDLNSFLFAIIGEERSGAPLSVVSALARQGFDPWQEAQRLADLPKGIAAETLAQQIAALPTGLWPLPVANGIAARLVSLLPRGNGSLGKVVVQSHLSWRWLVLVSALIVIFAGLASYYEVPLQVTGGTHEQTPAHPASSSNRD